MIGASLACVTLRALAALELCEKYHKTSRGARCIVTFRQIAVCESIHKHSRWHVLS